MQRASSRTKTLAAGSPLIHVNQSLKVSVPAEMGIKALLELAVVDSQTGKDVGNIIFPLSKVAASTIPVQGWYKLVQEGMIKEDETRTDVCIKCKISVEDAAMHPAMSDASGHSGICNLTTSPLPPGPIYRPSRLSEADADWKGIGVVLSQFLGIWFVDGLVPGGAAARSGCVQLGDQLCAMEHIQAGASSPQRLLVGAGTSIEDVSNFMKRPPGLFVKLTLARGASVFGVMLVCGQLEERPENEMVSSPTGRSDSPKPDDLMSNTVPTSSPSTSAEVASAGCISFLLNSKQKHRRHIRKKQASSSPGKAQHDDHFAPIAKHHMSPGIPPALAPLPRTLHVVWDDEAIEHMEPAQHPDQHYNSTNSKVMIVYRYYV